MTPDFMLDPDELEPERPAHRPVRLVATGLAPTAEVPSGRRKHAEAACYVPCSLCSAMVLTGATTSGQWLALDIQVPTYSVVWHTGTSQPLLQPSRAYPVHQCGQRTMTSKEA
jgi:hypothetical protein